LLNLRYEVDRYDRLSNEYDDVCQKLLKRIEYINDPEKIKDEEEILKARNELLGQDKFCQSLKDRILSSKFNNHIKSILYDKYIAMENSNGDDIAKIKEWIETVLSVPQKPNVSHTNKLNNEQVSKIISDTMIALDKKVYGMIAAKEEFLCMLTNIIGNPKSKNKAIGLYGPPGIGKTLLAMIISDVLNKPMAKISLGGITDSSFLEVHGYTYIGSQPGCIAKAVIQMGCTDGIIYLDEIDKISKSHHGKEIEHALLHITDFTQNHDFRDKYMPEIPIDLSECIFIYSLNSSEEMDSALVSRIPIIKFDGYTNKEKMIILQNYMLPELLRNYGMKSGDIVIPHEIASHLINHVKEVDANSEKSGVRSLKNVLSSILNRINLYRLGSVNGQLSVKLSFTIKNFKMPYTLDLDLVNSVLSNYDDNSWKNSYGHLYL
jgi:ATP-dependent Lon protease